MGRAKRKKPKKEFSSAWAFAPFDRDPTFDTKRMFGCLAGYLRGRMVMVLTEDPGDKAYRGKRYRFDIWDGILLPTEKIYHGPLMKSFSGLRPHPVLGKWLYLPAEHEDFEAQIRDIGDLIARGDPRFGIEPKIKRPKTDRPRAVKHGLKEKKNPL